MIKIAVCMYGCWRTGDKCIDYIKDFFDCNNSEVQVDFFCSIKSVDQYLNVNKHKIYDHKLDDNEIETIISKLNNTVVPKSINILIDDENSSVLQKKLSGIIDSVFLKKKYEVENNIEYDITVAIRYDTIVIPSSYFKNFVTGLLLDENKFIISKENILKPSSILFTNKLTHLWRSNGMSDCSGADNPWAGISVYLDNFLFGLHKSLDKIAYEMLNFCRNGYEQKRFMNIYEMHYALTHSIQKSFITVIDTPLVSDNNIYIDGFHNKSDTITHIYDKCHIIILRPDFKWTDDDNIFLEDTQTKISHHFNMDFT